jgi:hypothetical protein
VNLKIWDVHLHLRSMDCTALKPFRGRTLSHTQMVRDSEWSPLLGHALGYRVKQVLRPLSYSHACDKLIQSDNQARGMA